MRSRTPRWIRRAMLAAIALPALADDLVEPVSSPVAPPAVGPIETVELPVRWPLAEREAFRSALAAAQQRGVPSGTCAGCGWTRPPRH
jgi:hypothetical protein